MRKFILVPILIIGGLILCISPVTAISISNFGSSPTFNQAPQSPTGNSGQFNPDLSNQILNNGRGKPCSDEEDTSLPGEPSRSSDLPPESFSPSQDFDVLPATQDGFDPDLDRANLLQQEGETYQQWQERLKEIARYNDYKETRKVALWDIEDPSFHYFYLFNFNTEGNAVIDRDLSSGEYSVTIYALKEAITPDDENVPEFAEIIIDAFFDGLSEFDPEILSREWEEGEEDVTSPFEADPVYGNYVKTDRGREDGAQVKIANEILGLYSYFERYAPELKDKMLERMFSIIDNHEANPLVRGILLDHTTKFWHDIANNGLLDRIVDSAISIALEDPISNHSQEKLFRDEATLILCLAARGGYHRDYASPETKAKLAEFFVKAVFNGETREKLEKNTYLKFFPDMAASLGKLSKEMTESQRRDLLSRLSNEVDILPAQEDIFIEFGIPVVRDTGENFPEREVEIILNFLRAINVTENEIISDSLSYIDAIVSRHTNPKYNPGGVAFEVPTPPLSFVPGCTIQLRGVLGDTVELKDGSLLELNPENVVGILAYSLGQIVWRFGLSYEQQRGFNGGKEDFIISFANYIMDTRYAGTVLLPRPLGKIGYTLEAVPSEIFTEREKFIAKEIFGYQLEDGAWMTRIFYVDSNGRIYWKDVNIGSDELPEIPEDWPPQ